MVFIINKNVPKLCTKFREIKVWFWASKVMAGSWGLPEHQGMANRPIHKHQMEQVILKTQKPPATYWIFNRLRTVWMQGSSSPSHNFSIRKVFNCHDFWPDLHLRSVILKLRLLFLETCSFSSCFLRKHWIKAQKIRTKVRIFCVHLFCQCNLVDDMGIEPTTSALRTLRSPSWANRPYKILIKTDRK